MKNIAIIQARMGSSRLPGKVMKQIKGKSVLEHVVERVSQSKLLDEIIIATTTEAGDDIIVEECRKIGIKYYRGSEDDVLERYYLAAKKHGADNIVRITSDCPLIDPSIIDEVIEFYLNNNYKIVTNAGNKQGERTYPRGLDVEVTGFECLEDAYLNARKLYQREHVTPYIYETYEDETYYYKNKLDYSNYRITLDTEEDLKVIKNIYDHLYKGDHNFYMEEIVNYLDKNPGIRKINREIIQKNYKE